MSTLIDINGSLTCVGLALSGELAIAGPVVINGVLHQASGSIFLTPDQSNEPPPADGLVILPTNMTGPSQNGFVFTQSSFYNEGALSAQGYNMANGIYSNNWYDGISTALGAVGPHWWRIKLPAPRWIRRVEARCRTDAPELVPQSFRIRDRSGASPVDMLLTGPLTWQDGQTNLDTTSPRFTDDFEIYVDSHSGVLCQLAKVQFKS
jgi:hypothetical protein